MIPYNSFMQLHYLSRVVVWTQLSQTTTTTITDTSPTPEVDRIKFEATIIKAPFLEQFTSDWSKRWSPSEATKETKDRGEVFSYIGEWAVEEPTILPGIEGDTGLVVKSVAAFHAISAPFDEPLDNTDKTLKGLECGGAYLKLLTKSEKGIQAEEFSDQTPYTIMFGPDRCGNTNKVHFIFRHKNPKTGEYEEKHLTGAPSAKLSKTSTLYTLIVRPDNSFDLQINNVSEKSGSLLEDFTPPVNPTKEIDDPNDKKPADWVDTVKISDPDAKKPDDWDEDAPQSIPDEDAVKPDDWLEDEPETIPDPDSKKPEDWDDEEDGDWVPLTIENPKCETVSGCGPWKRPTKRNPAYKGKWYPPMIDNPAYKGLWAPRKIPNPDYFEDLKPAKFEEIAGIGFELWTMQNDILFDNIYIGHSEEDAKKFAEETWAVKYKIEKAAEDKDSDIPDDIDSSPTFWDDPIEFCQYHVNQFLSLLFEEPLEALKTYPETAGILGLIIVILFSLIGILFSLLTPTKKLVVPHKKTDEPTPDDPDADVGESMCLLLRFPGSKL
ncbi:7248_t:CDS:10 [Ambispora gerdemannii]|uniref:7248_t:CDS:1 n=1 Tax=Ambispora gerdemannii TaxID=144530 RepID=A0A9N8VJT0_9GLOM|nr:7248_t:CDS:10 [Ambispora gerdemannii]